MGHPPESGLDEFGARYYSSWLGRFTIPDWSERPADVPYAHFGDPQSLNLYSYVRNNPMSTVDLDGHSDAGTFCDDQCRYKSPIPEAQLFGNPRVRQAAGGLILMGVGVGLMATAAGGDIPGAAAGASMASTGASAFFTTSAIMGSASTLATGTALVAGAATNTNVTAATDMLSATSNPGGLATTALTGNVGFGKTAAMGNSVLSLARNPQGAVRNPATAVKAIQTGTKVLTAVSDAATTMLSAVQGSLALPPPPPPPPPPPSCSGAGAGNQCR